jgi:uncharacterized cupredoxin-like copper-binding protein
MQSPTRSALLGAATLSALAALPATCALAHGERHGSQAAVRKEQRAWGIAGDARAVRRAIEVGMADSMRFTPEQITVRRGETVRFVLRNDGKEMHEFVLGTRRELDKHAALMLRFPGMAHDEPYMAHVPPGQRAEIVWHFNRAGAFEFACLIAGHYQAGMVGKVTVAAT